MIKKVCSVIYGNTLYILMMKLLKTIRTGYAFFIKLACVCFVPLALPCDLVQGPSKSIDKHGSYEYFSIFMCNSTVFIVFDSQKVKNYFRCLLTNFDAGINIGFKIGCSARYGKTTSYNDFSISMR